MSRKTSFFTLLELLVVIAVIAILAMLLLPALKRVKDVSRGVLCASNLRQMGMTLNSYLGSYNDFFPYANRNDEDVKKFNWNGFEMWFLLLLNEQEGRERNSTSLGKNKIALCPDWQIISPQWIIKAQFAHDKLYIGAYAAMTGSFRGIQNKSGLPGHKATEIRAASKKMALMDFHGGTVPFYDGAPLSGRLSTAPGGDYYLPGDIQNGISPQNVGTDHMKDFMQGRHGMTNGVLFVDGHVEKRTPVQISRDYRSGMSNSWYDGTPVLNGKTESDASGNMFILYSK